MNTNQPARFSTQPLPATRRELLAGSALAILTMGSLKVWAAEDSGISSAEAIHQEPVLKASPGQIYRTLTDTKQFDAVAHLGVAMRSMVSGAKPTVISSEVGGAFTLFGGHIVGRHLELVPNERIVQAWREQSWKPGEYSIASFVLVPEGSGAKIVFNHRGFPQGAAPHLAVGWRSNYWEPLEKYLMAKK